MGTGTSMDDIAIDNLATLASLADFFAAFQGLTLFHFSAQPEPFLTGKTRNTP